MAQRLAVIAGFCPMGCGFTLSLDAGQAIVRCSAEDCPRPEAAHDILMTRETEHIVTLRGHGEDGGFSIEHPLRERLGSALHKCQLHVELRGLSGSPEEPGRYRVTAHQPDPISEPYSPGAIAWDFELIELTDA